MAEPHPSVDLDTANDPRQVGRQEFSLDRRGYDRDEVRSYLRATAEALRDAQSREADMRTRLGKAVRRAEAAEAAAKERSTDESDLTRQLGDEVTGVLDAARAAGEQRIAAAEKSAEQLLANAKAEAGDIRGAAETIMDERRAEADATAAKMLAEASAQAEALRESGRAEAAAVIASAGERLERAKAEAEALVRQADDARLQILLDMDRRRREARAQVERLRVGRDRLLKSYELVRRNMIESTKELDGSLGAAKSVGDAAARRIATEPLSSTEELELEQQARAPRPAPTTAKVVPTGDDAAADDEGASAQAERPSATLPRVDVRARRGETAPAPQRPQMRPPVARATNDAPRPPAVAPRIKADGASVTEAAAPSQPGSATATDGPRETVDSAKSAAADLPEDLAALKDPDLIVVDPPDAIEAVAVRAVTTDESADAAKSAKPLDAKVEKTEKAPVKPAKASDAFAKRSDTSAKSGGVERKASGTSAKSGGVERKALGTSSKSGGVERKALDTSAKSQPVDKKASGKSADKKASGAVKDRSSKASTKPPAESATPDSPNRVKAAEAVKASKAARTAARAQTAKSAGATVSTPKSSPAARASASSGIFAALREQAHAGTVNAADTSAEQKPASAKKPPSGRSTEAPVQARPATPTNRAEVDDATDATDVETAAAPALREARAEAVAAAADRIRRRLGRALADEQNDLLAAIGASKKTQPLLPLVGTDDEQVNRYVSAIGADAERIWAAGGELAAGQAPDQLRMPAGAIEEMIVVAVVEPARTRLSDLDHTEGVDSDLQVDAVRAFYRQHKTDQLGPVAERIAEVLSTAGACEALGDGTPLPW